VSFFVVILPKKTMGKPSHDSDYIGTPKWRSDFKQLSDAIEETRIDLCGITASFDPVKEFNVGDKVNYSGEKNILNMYGEIIKLTEINGEIYAKIKSDSGYNGMWFKISNIRHCTKAEIKEHFKEEKTFKERESELLKEYDKQVKELNDKHYNYLAELYIKYGKADSRVFATGKAKVSDEKIQELISQLDYKRYSQILSKVSQHVLDKQSKDVVREWLKTL
jgi:hypothetical protein